MKVEHRQIPLVDRPLDRAPDHVWMSPDISLWGWGEAARFHPGTGADRVDRLRRDLESFFATLETEDDFVDPGSGPVAFVSTTFATGSPGSVAIVPALVVGRAGDRWWTTRIGDGPPLPPPSSPPASRDRARYAGSSMPDVLWLEAVSRAIDHIRQGRVSKVVLARDYAVWSRQPFSPAVVLQHLANRFPSCQIFQVAGLVGASPEILVRRRGSAFDSLVLAGSAASHDDPEADYKAGQGLLSSTKDRWEHELAVRSVTESLTRIGLEHTVLGGPRLLRLDNVQHLATPVVGESGDRHVLELVEALHPTAAVGGTPTPAAVALIAELEGMDRGRYAGPIGWVDGSGNGDFAIALRCAELSGARARLFAGAGIVEASLPEDELEETRIKLGAMMGAIAAGSD